MKRDLAGNEFNVFWCVVNWRGEFWPMTACYSRAKALAKFAELGRSGSATWRAAYRRGFRCVRVRMVRRAAP